MDGGALKLLQEKGRKVLTLTGLAPVLNVLHISERKPLLLKGLEVSAASLKASLVDVVPSL